MAAIVDVGITKFGKRKESVIELAAEACMPILRKHHGKVDLLIVSNTYSGELNSVSGINSLLASYLSLDNVRSLKVDNTSGSGGTAIFAAKAFIDANMAKNVLVVGVEKMHDKDTGTNTDIISTLLADRERAPGTTLTSLAPFAMQAYMQEYNRLGVGREAIAWVAVKNHRNGALNQYAHFYKKEVTIEEVMNSRVISDPLRLMEYASIADGAAAVLITSNKNAINFDTKPVFIRGISLKAATAHLTRREGFVSIDVVRESGKEAYGMAGIGPKDVGFAELHDMATILEVVQSEDLGLLRRGHGWYAARDGITALRGDIPINPSGGLKARGHPIGASGVAQAVEAFMQIRGEAGERQVKSNKVGLSVGMTGFGNAATTIIYGADE